MIRFETFELANGLKVHVHEDRDVPKVAVDIVYHVGARNEQPGRTGLAHLFEHLMFGGSRNAPDFDTWVQRAGGENNAFTNNDITNYYITLPSGQLELALWLESDRMAYLDLSQKAVDVQKSVVCEEFKQRYLNQPFGDAYLHLRPLVYKVHPYQWMTIGQNLEQIEAVTREEALAFYTSYYAPNNATLVVAGDVKTAEVERLVKKWFGDIPAQPLAKKPLPQEPTQQEARKATVHGKVPHTAVYRAYRVPPRNHPDFYATDLLTDVLGGGKGARLYNRLVKELKVATSVSAFSWGLYDDSMISVNGQVAEGHSVEAYEAALDAALQEIYQVDAEELARYQTKMESGDAFDKTAVSNRAMALAISDSIGNPNLINTDVDAYRAVTIEGLHATARTVLRPDNCSTLYYLPE